MSRKNTATVYAILAAALYAVNIPLSKLLMEHIGSAMMASLLYLGAGIGLLLYGTIRRMGKQAQASEHLTKRELPYTIAMVVLDILAPILLMMGILRTNSANVSLLNNFEIVATSMVALVVFQEAISGQLWLAIALVTAASAILSFEGAGSFAFNEGSVLVLGACVCWGFENNCTKRISNKSTVEIVVIKGCFSGLGSLICALLLGEKIPQLSVMVPALLLGFVAYGLSIKFYITAQRDLGAAKTSAYYSIAPFLGVAFSMVLLRERPGIRFYAALALMVVSTILMVRDSITLQNDHVHAHTHDHEHRHGDLLHSHEHTHRHRHSHVHLDREGEDAHTHRHDDLENHDHIHPDQLP